MGERGGLACVLAVKDDDEGVGTEIQMSARVLLALVRAQRLPSVGDAMKVWWW
jgi:hypothetical protein